MAQRLLIFLALATLGCSLKLEAPKDFWAHGAPGTRTALRQLPPRFPKTSRLRQLETLFDGINVNLKNITITPKVNLKNITITPKENLRNISITPKDVERVEAFSFGGLTIHYPEHLTQPGDAVTFTSPNYPSNYPSNKAVVWSFYGAASLTMQCDAFNVVKTRGRCDDVLLVLSSQLNDIFCGNENPFAGPTQIGEGAVVTFASNRRRAASGFSCTVRYGTSPPPTTTAAPPGNTCKCGKVNRAVRIVGGVETEVNEYPWQVAFVFSGTSSVFCGGSVVANNMIVTAAHCGAWSTMQSGNYDILLAAHTPASPTAEQLRISGSGQQITVHEGYNSDNQDNDIAIITLNPPLDFEGTAVRPVCLPQVPTETYANQDVIATGWGTLSSGGVQPSALQEVTLTAYSNAYCSQNTGYPSSWITDNMLCAGVPGGGKDTCQGDSGGPLVFDASGSYELVGVTSWGIGCADASYPGVYARVTNYLSWLQGKGFSNANTCPR